MNKRKSERHEVIDTVGHLLHFSAPVKGGGRREEEERERAKRRREEEEQENERRIEEAKEYVKSQAAGRRGFLGVNVA